MMAELQAGYVGAKAAMEIAKGIFSLKSEAERNQAVIDIQRHVLEAQNGLSAAQEAQAANLRRICELEEEIVRLKQWDGEVERYQLKRFHPDMVAYELKPEMAGRDPPHRLCYDCYQRRQKGVLNATERRVLRYTIHRCTSCKAEAAIGDEMEPGPVPEPAQRPTPQVIMRRP